MRTLYKRDFDELFLGRRNLLYAVQTHKSDSKTEPVSVLGKRPFLKRVDSKIVVVKTKMRNTFLVIMFGTLTYNNVIVG
jgi:hypothetical protein